MRTLLHSQSGVRPPNGFEPFNPTPRGLPRSVMLLSPGRWIAGHISPAGAFLCCVFGSPTIHELLHKSRLSTRRISTQSATTGYTLGVWQNPVDPCPRRLVFSDALPQHRRPSRATFLTSRCGSIHPRISVSDMLLHAMSFAALLFRVMRFDGCKRRKNSH